MPQRKAQNEVGDSESIPQFTNLLNFPQAYSLGQVRAIVATDDWLQKTITRNGAVFHGRYAVAEIQVRLRKGLEDVLDSVRSARNVIVRLVRIPDGKAIGLLRPTVDAGY